MEKGIDEGGVYRISSSSSGCRGQEQEVKNNRENVEMAVIPP